MLNMFGFTKTGTLTTFFIFQFKSTPGKRNEFTDNVVKLLKLPEMGS
jgi:hypothetical protein